MTKYTSARVLVTGASGFLGSAVCQHLLDGGFTVRACVRNSGTSETLRAMQGPIELCEVTDITAKPDWSRLLNRVEAVIHLAARAHVQHERVADPLSEYRRVNVSATKCLAEAMSHRSARLIFVSSIGVNGNCTGSKPFDEDDPANPQTPYAVSKWEAENALRDIARQKGLEIVIIRPPLVYGPGVKANFLRLLNYVYRGVPLPISFNANRRSLIGVDNLADVLVRCVSHPAAADRTFVVSDGEDLSTFELISYFARKFDRPLRCVRLPEVCLRLGASLVGHHHDFEKFCASLVVNCAKARERLRWNPPRSLKDGLLRTAQWFLAECAGAR